MLKRSEAIAAARSAATLRGEAGVTSQRSARVSMIPATIHVTTLVGNLVAHGPKSRSLRALWHRSNRAGRLGFDGHRFICRVAVVTMVAVLSNLVGTSSSAFAASATRAVTATTIRVGIPYINLAALKSVGVDINWGSLPDAYMAIIANINAHGGINGRKIVPDIIGVAPSAAPAATTCTQLTEDDPVFVAIAPLQPTCYLQHGVSVINSLEPATTSTSGIAQNFSLSPPASAFDPVQLSVFAKQGVFKNKKVGVFGGGLVDESEIAIVKAELKKLGVPVVVTAVNSAPLGDLPAENGQVAVIVQRFQTFGVNEVVAVGNGSAIWPEALSSIQSSYNPPWIATAEGGLAGSAGSDNPIYIKNVVAASPIPTGATVWNDAGTQRCVRIVRKAYPSDHINTYNSSLPTSQATWTGVEQACTDLGLFSAIATAAGKHLTVASFVHAGEALHGVVIAGSSTAISFGRNQPYALGPVYLAHYDAAAKTLVLASKSATK